MQRIYPKIHISNQQRLDIYLFTEELTMMWMTLLSSTASDFELVNYNLH